MGIFCFCWEGELRLVDKFKGCELESMAEVVELALMAPLVSTALSLAAASAKECSLESSSGCVCSNGAVMVTPVLERVDLEEETPSITVGALWCEGFVGACGTGICLLPIVREAEEEYETSAPDAEGGR